MDEAGVRTGPGGYTVWAVVVLGLALVVAAILLALREPAPAPAVAGPPPVAPDAKSESPGEPLVAVPHALDRAEVAAMLARLSPQRRGAVLANEQTFDRAVREEGARRAVVAAAVTDGFAARAQISALMRRAAEQALVESYLAVASRQAVPADFPSEAQVHQAYDSNREKLKLAERTELWQIFLPFGPSADDAARAAVRDRAAAIVRALREGTTTFAEAAATYSAHTPSRTRGGFMGVTALDKLSPDLRDRVRALAPGEISDPIESGQGMHVLKRGKIVGQSALTFDAARAGIREGLLRGALAKAREKVIAGAVDRFAPLPSAADLKSWRDALRETTPEKGAKKSATGAAPGQSQ